MVSLLRDRDLSLLPIGIVICVLALLSPLTLKGIGLLSLAFTGGVISGLWEKDWVLNLLLVVSALLLPPAVIFVATGYGTGLWAKGKGLPLQGKKKGGGKKVLTAGRKEGKDI
jgi:hypothetical protein